MPLHAAEKGLILPRALYVQMLAHVESCLPEEACGILGGWGGEASLALAVENELHSAVRFRMRAVEQLRAMVTLEEAGMDLIAIWHSHPHGPAHLSPTDLAEAYYPEALLLVWAPDDDQPFKWQLLAFRLMDGQAEAAPVRVV